MGIQKANLAYSVVEKRDGLDLVFAQDTEDLIAALLDGWADAIFYPRDRVWQAAKAGESEACIEEVNPAFLITLLVPPVRFGLGEARERLNANIPGYLISDDYSALHEKCFGQECSGHDND